MPLRLTNPTVGLRPTSEQAAEGDVMEPSNKAPSTKTVAFSEDVMGGGDEYEDEDFEQEDDKVQET